VYGPEMGRTARTIANEISGLSDLRRKDAVALLTPLQWRPRNQYTKHSIPMSCDIKPRKCDETVAKAVKRWT